MEVAGSNPAGGAEEGGMARYANRQSDPAQTRGSCGSESHPCYFLFSNGLLVQRHGTGIARRRSVFDSPAVHSAESAIEGPMVQGDDVALAWRRSGFDSRWVHSNGR